MYIYIVYYCILIVFCIIGLRVFHGLININQSIDLPPPPWIIVWSIDSCLLSILHQAENRLHLRNTLAWRVVHHFRHIRHKTNSQVRF